MLRPGGTCTHARMSSESGAMALMVATDTLPSASGRSNVSPGF